MRLSLVPLRFPGKTLLAKCAWNYQEWDLKESGKGINQIAGEPRTIKGSG